IKIEDIVAVGGSSDQSIGLVAVLNHPRAMDSMEILWRTEGGGEGVTIDSGDDGTALLELGNTTDRLTISACLTDGIRTGGCMSVELDLDRIDAIRSEKIWREVEQRDWEEDVCLNSDDDSLQHVFHPVNSRVNTVTGRYYREHEDLSVKVPGGYLSAFRRYRNQRWEWDHVDRQLHFDTGVEKIPVSIRRRQVRYRRDGNTPHLYRSRGNTLARDGDHWLWENRVGEWERYNAAGRLVSFGNRLGLVGRCEYEKNAITALVDRNGRKRLRFFYNSHGEISTVTDGESEWVDYQYLFGKLSRVGFADGRWMRFFYDEKDRLNRIKYPSGKTIHIRYDQSGKVCDVRNGEGKGHAFTYAYDWDANLYEVRSESSSGKVQKTWFNKSGEAQKVTINGRLHREYIKRGNQLDIVDGAGRVTKKSFDDLGNLIEVVFSNGERRRFQYDSSGTMLTLFENENRVQTQFGYDSYGRLIECIEAFGSRVERTTRFEWDSHGNIVRLAQCADSPDEAITLIAYDENGNPQSFSDPEGSVHQLQVNASGDILSLDTPEGAKWVFERDPVGRLLTLVNPLGQRKRWIYHVAEQQVRHIDERGGETTAILNPEGTISRLFDPEKGDHRYEYDSEGRLLRFIDPGGVKTHFFYDSMNRLLRIEDGAGNQIQLDYDDAFPPNCATCSNPFPDNPTRIVFPTFTRELIYDQRGRVSKRMDIAPTGETRIFRFGHDAAGNLVTVEDPAGRKTLLRYDELNRCTSMVDAKGGVTKFGYDGRDNLTRLEDPNGNVVTVDYDRNNRLIKETRPGGQSIRYRYDGTGNLLEKEGPTGRTVRFDHDLAGRVVRGRFFTDPASPSPENEIHFSYDSAGNLTAYEDSESSGRYCYDALNRKVEETIQYGPLMLSNHYQYDQSGKLVTFTGPDGESYRYAYDFAGRLAKIDIPNAGQVVYSSTGIHEPEKVLYPNGFWRALTYDAFGRVLSIVDQTESSKLLLERKYAYDNAGHISGIDSEEGRFRYRYDDLGRLIQAVTPFGEEAFSYDPVGNRSGLASGGSPWIYSGNNELTRSADSRIAYDAFGRRVYSESPEETHRYDYNAAGRLAAVTIDHGSKEISFGYDPFGRRIWKEVDGKRVFFHYSDQGLIGEYNVKGKPIRRYGWKPGRQWGTDPLVLKESGKTYFYLNDHLGTPQQMVDRSGKAIWSGSYKSFGSTDGTFNSKIVNNLRFPGHYRDQETGLHYNYFRYYDPETGQYLSPDPLGLVDGTNLYSYVQNNPVAEIDPLGLYKSSDFLRAVVPGQVAYDYGRTAIENGEYGLSALYFGAMVGEQVLFALSLGQSSAYRVGGKCVVSKIGTNLLEDIAAQATRNPNSNKVVLGKWLQEGKSYTEVGAHFKASYLKLENWRELSKTMTQDELWKVNETF
ncbi:MAG: RHS repeat-associated core domain-containing protein, partial [Desulfobacterales bacterium]